MDYKINLQQDKTGQKQRLTRIFLQQLQLIPKYKQELRYILTEVKRFFQKATWLHDTMSFSIYKVLNELEDVDVYTTITLDTPKTPTNNDGRFGREDIQRQI